MGKGKEHRKDPDPDPDPAYFMVDVKCGHSCPAISDLFNFFKAEGVTVQINESCGFNESYGIILTIPTSKEGTILKALEKNGSLNVHVITHNNGDEGGLTWTAM